MVRLIAGLLVAGAGGVAVVALDLRQAGALAPLVGLAVGLLLGLIAGWRAPRPGHVVESALLAGALAGALLAILQVYGLLRVEQSATGLRLPGWLLAQATVVTLFWWLAGASAILCFLFTMGVSGAMAGIVSAWTGLRARVAAPPASPAPVSRGRAPVVATVGPVASVSPTPLAAPARATDTGGLLPRPMD